MPPGLKIIAIIPARAGSKRVPNKNIRNIWGQTLFERAIKIAKLSGIFSDIIATSDSDEYLQMATAIGATIIKRPPDICDAPDTYTWLDYVLHQIKKAD